MEIVNTTPYRFHAFDCSAGPKLPALSFIVKGTFALRLDEPAVAAPPDEQEPLRGDEQHMDDLGRSLAYATDLCAVKTRGEVMLLGHCFPEGGRPRTECDVSLEIGPIRKSLKICGDRKLTPAGGLSAAQPFERMPLRWEHAFGSLGDARNPVGRGVDAWPDAAGGADAVLFPNIEHPEHRMQRATDRPEPAGFGPISPAWAPRLTRLGTRDARWAAFRAPLPPVDFDPRANNAAPDDQQLADGCYFRGDEPFALTHVRPEVARFAGSLPGKRLRVFAAIRANGAAPKAFVEIEMHLDTVIFDTDGEKLVCVWRRPFGVSAAGHPEIEAVYIAEESLVEEPLPAAFHEARFRELRPDQPSQDELMQVEMDAQMGKADKVLADGGVDPKVRASVAQAEHPKDALEVLVREAERMMKELQAMTARLGR